MKFCDWCPNPLIDADFCSNACRDAFHNAGGNAKLPGNPKTGTIPIETLGGQINVVLRNLSVGLLTKHEAREMILKITDEFLS